MGQCKTLVLRARSALVDCMNASSIDRILLDSQKNRVVDVAGLKTYEPLFAKYRAEQQRAEQRQQRIESKEQRTAERLVEPTTQESPQSTRQHRSEPPVVISTGLAAPSPDLSSSQPVESPQPPGAARRKQVEKKIPQPPPPPPPSAYALASGCYCQPRVGAALCVGRRDVMLRHPSGVRNYPRLAAIRYPEAIH